MEMWDEGLGIVRRYLTAACGFALSTLHSPLLPRQLRHQIDHFQRGQGAIDPLVAELGRPAASLPVVAAWPPERAIACSSVLQVKIPNKTGNP